MSIQFLFADASGAVTIGWWMALLMFIPFAFWAWLLSAKLDKDAYHFNIDPTMWNSIHLACGVTALAAMLFIPVIGVSWVVGVIILFTPVLIYWKVRNGRVPEAAKYFLTTASFKKNVQNRRKARASRDAVLEFTDANGEKRDVPKKDDPIFPTHMLAEDLIAPAVDARSSRMDIVATSNGTLITQTIDGVPAKREAVPVEQAMSVIDYIKELAGLDASDRRRRQAGTFHLSGPNGKVEVDATTQGSSKGVQLRLDFDRAKRLSKPVDALGFLPSQLESIKKLTEVENRHGVVLVGAPSGHGLTTTAYSLISQHDAYTSNVKSLEREIQTTVVGVDQVEWDPNNPDVDYATNVQSILRRDPDVVLTDVLLSPDTAKVLADPGMSGPLLYVQQRCATLVEQMKQWVKFVGDVKPATQCLRAVTNQRLVRTLCPNCRQAFEPTPDQLKKLNLPAGKVKQLYRAGGKVQVKNNIEDCPVCNGAGYLGQSAVFEVMYIDDECRKILGTGDLKAALAQARRNKMMYLQEAAMSKVVAGETSIEEVIRVTAPKSSGKPSPKPKEEATTSS